jgi:hypothetical protein
MSSFIVSEVYSLGDPPLPSNPSIIPCLIPRGIAKAIKQTKLKILLLNSCHDRETTGFDSAGDYIQAIVDACMDSLEASGENSGETVSWTTFITHLVYLRDGGIPVDVPELKKRGVECVGIWSGDGRVYDAGVLERVLNGICSGRGGGLQRRATVQIGEYRPETPRERPY